MNSNGNGMKVKIEEKNASAIEAALKAVNGRATAHAYTDYAEIAALADESEKEVLALVGSRKAAVGAVVESTSGGKVPNAYAKIARNRVGTTVKIERFATGWFLTGVKSATIYQSGGSDRLTLTEAQDAEAVKRLRSQYLVTNEA